MNSITLVLPDTAIRNSYAVLFTATGVLALATALSDLRSPMVANVIGMHLDLKLEGNFAVWYSSTVLLMAAAGAFTVGRRVRPDSRVNRARRLWTIVALFFLFLSIDETAQLHEKVGVIFTQRFGTVPFLTEGGWPAFAWLLVLLPFIVLFFVCMLTAVRCFLGLYPRSRRLVFGGLACWAGVLAAEFVQAQLVRWSWQRSLQGVIEEGLELTGATLFLVAFTEYLRGDARERAAVEVHTASEAA